MRPLILHGLATSASRKKLLSIKEKFNSDNVVTFASKTDLQEILISLQSQSLFDGDRLIIIENPPEDSILNLSLITYHSSLILWFDHEIDIKKWPGFESLLFPESKEISVFPFLDCLAVKDKKAFLELEKLKKGGFDIYYLLTMVFYLLRSLVNIPKNAPDFVRKKLLRQKTGFSLEKITSLYQELLEIDFKIKSGLLEKDQAEFLLLFQFLSH